MQEKPNSPNRRKYSAQFKAQVVAQCRQAGTSVASVALRHGINHNVVHRWLKENEHAGLHRLGGPAMVSPAALAVSGAGSAAFIPVPMGASLAPLTPAIEIELGRGSLHVKVRWPLEAAGACTQFLQALAR